MSFPLTKFSLTTLTLPCLSALLLSNTTFAQEEAARPLTVGDVIARPGVLTPKGKLTFDASLSYTQNSSNKVSVVGYTVLPTLIVGRIEVSDSDRTTITAGMSARYGLTNTTELELRLPFVYRNDQISTRPIQDGAQDNTVNITLDGGGLGDVELALRHQFNVDSTPYWIGGLSVKSDSGKSPYDIEIDDTTNTYKEVPTGSGFWSIEPSLSMIYPTDPAVLFTSFSYIYNFEDDVNVGDSSSAVKLGDTLSLGAGIGFSVNPDLSFSLGLSHKTILKSTLDGEEADDAKLLQLDSINFGVNYAFSKTSSLNVNAQAGLTEDTPDFQLTVRVPFSF